MVYIKKHADENGICEYIDPTDIFEFFKEGTDQAGEMYTFLLMVAEELNYFNDHSSTAFGNPDYEYKRGKVEGYLRAKHWDWEETGKSGNVIISIKTRSGRAIMKIEKPKIPDSEIENRRNVAQLRRDFGF